ncbi:glycosyltransferase [Sphingomonas sp.]|jgi:cellulose synthase/poly-beta-1,6-N-acetylglucosamine synthase-like glycosyltransferase|uniref:glycosyltransferase family 2 protein n=1 Tax=Sphingomonas sp. TaxID=28214 RepID=UPI002E12DB24|nr:glycosyltransferase [Sphingomonas sp.]
MTWALAGTYLILTFAWLSFGIILIRNAVSLVQLVTAAYVFRARLRPTRAAQTLWSRQSDCVPPLTIIAPAYNEELSIVQSVRSLLALEYPEHEVIVVNDGSSDDTLRTLVSAFELDRVERRQVAVLQRTEIRGVYVSRTFPNLTVIDKENGRKADAANAGIGFALTPLVCVIDADSIIESDGLLRATEPFMNDDGSLVAVGGAIRIVNGCTVRGGSLQRIEISKNWIARFQIVEYLRAFLTARVANARLGVLLLISGAFGVFDRETVLAVGGYRHDTVGEDLELVVRIHRHMREQGRNYRVDFIPEIVCWTEAPTTLGGLRNQRARWQQGALETLGTHRRMLFNPRFGRIGWFAMPHLVLEDVIGPPAELLGYLVIPVAWALGVLSVDLALAYLALTFLFGTALSLGTLALEETQLRRTPTARQLAALMAAAIFENFGFRQAVLVFRLVGIKRHLRRERGWSAVPRIGFGN